MIGRIEKVNKPSEISASGWKKILFKVKDEVSKKNLSIVSAGVAFYAFLAIFPALIAFVSIYGLALDPHQIEQQISQFSGMMPQEAFEILKQQIKNFISTSDSTLNWGIVLSILFSLWSANKGTKSLFTGINIVYKTETTRGFFKLNGLTLLFTLGAIILIILSMALIVAFPAFVDYLGLPQTIEVLISWCRWLVLGLIVIAALCALYKFAPNEPTPGLKWLKIGAIVATILWLIASWGFSFYVSNFGTYGEVYGSISAVIIFLLWLFLTCFIILLGAEINADTENYTKE